ncbi:MAG: glycosyltransferase [Bacteroidia bacterium]|nr:glycosyltransferase [Bacteroidia bacterium]
MKEVSIVVVIRNEINYIEEFCKNLNQFNTDIEIILVDNNSNDGTEKHLALLKSTNIKVVHNKIGFTPESINIGIDKAQGEFVVLCGARSLINVKYVTKCIEVLKSRSEIGCVGGLIFHEAKTFKGKMIAKAMGAKFGMGINSFRSSKQSGYVDTVSVPCFRKKTFNDIGKFDVQLTRNQDEDFSYRILKTGKKIWMESTINSVYYVRENYCSLRKQMYQYGYWKNYLNKKHGTITSLRQLVPAFLLLVAVSTLSISLIYNNIKLITLFLIAYAIGVFFLSIMYIGKNLKEAVFISSALIIIHSAYGFGYISGFINAIVLRKSPPINLKSINH